MEATAKDRALIAIIPARAGSERVVGKNIYPLRGHPLIAWTIAPAVSSGLFAKVIVSTDGEEIAAVSKSYGAEVIRRPPHLALNDSAPKEAVRHVCDILAETGICPEHIAYLQPTSPLREVGDIEATVSLVRRRGFDSAATFVEAEPHPDRAFLLNAGGAAEPVHGHEAVWQSRQDRAPRYHLNGAVYVMHAQTLFAEASNHMLHGRIGAHTMSQEHSIDIDTLVDLRICEALIDDLRPPLPKTAK